MTGGLTYRTSLKTSTSSTVDQILGGMDLDQRTMDLISESWMSVSQTHNNTTALT